MCKNWQKKILQDKNWEKPLFRIQHKQNSLSYFAQKYTKEQLKKLAVLRNMKMSYSLIRDAAILVHVFHIEYYSDNRNMIEGVQLNQDNPGIVFT